MRQPLSEHREASPFDRLRYGLEFEVPFKADENRYLTGRGKPATEESTGWFRSGDREMDYEWISASPSTYGWEARTTETKNIYGLCKWYRDAYKDIERHGNTIEPVGYHGDGTAGLHVHFSPLSEEQSELIRDVSREPWMRLLACTSVAAFDHHGERLPKYHVLRGEDPDVRSPCPDDDIGGHGKRRVVAKRNGTGHYEWRLPEPMLPISFDRLIEVVSVLLTEGADEAEAFARKIFREHPDKVTAIRRARAIQAECGDLPAMKEEQNATTDLLLEVM